MLGAGRPLPVRCGRGHAVVPTGVAHDTIPVAPTVDADESADLGAIPVLPSIVFLIRHRAITDAAQRVGPPHPPIQDVCTPGRTLHRCRRRGLYRHHDHGRHINGEVGREGQPACRRPRVASPYVPSSPSISLGWCPPPCSLTPPPTAPLSSRCQGGNEVSTTATTTDRTAVPTMAARNVDRRDKREPNHRRPHVAPTRRAAVVTSCCQGDCTGRRSRQPCPPLPVVLVVLLPSP
jgi:hypothetical protein